MSFYHSVQTCLFFPFSYELSCPIIPNGIVCDSLFPLRTRDPEKPFFFLMFIHLFTCGFF